MSSTMYNLEFADTKKQTAENIVKSTVGDTGQFSTSSNDANGLNAPRVFYEAPTIYHLFLKVPRSSVSKFLRIQWHETRVFSVTRL